MFPVYLSVFPTIFYQVIFIELNGRVEVGSTRDWGRGLCFWSVPGEREFS